MAAAESQIPDEVGKAKHRTAGSSRLLDMDAESEDTTNISVAHRGGKVDRINVPPWRMNQVAGTYLPIGPPQQDQLEARFYT